MEDVFLKWQKYTGQFPSHREKKSPQMLAIKKVPMYVWSLQM